MGGHLQIFRPKLYTDFAASHTKLYTPRPWSNHCNNTVFGKRYTLWTQYATFPVLLLRILSLFHKEASSPYRPDLSPFKTKHLDHSCIVTLQSVIFVFSVSEGEKTSDLMVTAGAWVRTQWTVWQVQFVTASWHSDSVDAHCQLLHIHWGRRIE